MSEMMELYRDWREFIECFNASQVEYLVVGALAVAIHARPRFTRDLDIWVNPSLENGGKIVSALRMFGFPLAGISPEDFSKPDVIFQLGVEPVRIDVITSISGVPDFGEAWNERTPGDFDGIPTNYIGRESLLRNKTATGRKKDIEDLDNLTNVD